MAKNTEPEVSNEHLPALVEAEIESWFRENFCNQGPILSEAAYNRAYAAKLSLKTRLAGLL